MADAIFEICSLHFRFPRVRALPVRQGDFIALIIDREMLVADAEAILPKHENRKARSTVYRKLLDLPNVVGVCEVKMDILAGAHRKPKHVANVRQESDKGNWQHSRRDSPSPFASDNGSNHKKRRQERCYNPRQ
jgi:hypothetical protein